MHINNYPPYGTKICSDIGLRTLSVPRSEQFSESIARENCELRGTDQIMPKDKGIFSDSVT